ncbi:MAG: hypothetical protein ACRD2T_09700 [Thermoanaerobaculia bacterium]
MKIKVTEEGVLIPKEMLEGIAEVEILREENLIVVMPSSEDDPRLGLGRSPVETGAPDGSEHHDLFLYGTAK